MSPNLDFFFSELQAYISQVIFFFSRNSKFTSHNFYVFLVILSLHFSILTFFLKILFISHNFYFLL